jgi:protein SCO1/2
MRPTIRRISPSRWRRWGRAAALLGLVSLLGLGPAPARGQEVRRLDGREAMRVSQEAIGRAPADHVLLNRQERPVSLSAYRGKPLLVSFIYTGCFQVCPTATRALDETVRALNKRFGESRFGVLSIGFNQPADSPHAMRAFAAQNRISHGNWDFLSAPAGVVTPLTSEFGFRYAATPAGFDHVLQVTLLDARGRIVRQVYGDTPSTGVLGDDLQRLTDGLTLPPRGLVADLADRIRLLCTVYDPDSGTYRVDYSLAWEMAGGVIFVLSVALYMLNEWRARRRERRDARLASEP